MKSIAIFFALISSCRGVTFDCLFVDQAWSVQEEKRYTCFVTDIQSTIDEKLTAVTSGNGHTSGKSNSDVEIVQILCKNNLNFVPKEMDKIFTNLIGIKIVDCKLSTLSSDDLESYENLKYFGATTAGIKEIPEELFEPAPNMKAIDFTDNQIKELSREFLRNLEKLKDLTWLSFKGNNCTDKAAIDRKEVEELIKDLKETCSTSAADGELKAMKIFQIISVIITVTFLNI